MVPRSPVGVKLEHKWTAAWVVRLLDVGQPPTHDGIVRGRLGHAAHHSLTSSRPGLLGGVIQVKEKFDVIPKYAPKERINQSISQSDRKLFF